MSVSQRTAQNIRERLLKKSDPAGLRRRLSPRLPVAEPLSDRLPLCNDHTAAGLEQRQGFLKQMGIAVDCLAMLGCVGEGTARKFAEICTATVLAGEISIMGALASGEFAAAHAKYARQRKKH